MRKRKFLKSIWFPVFLFILLEIIIFAIGFVIQSNSTCEMCPPAPAYCPPCSGVYVGFKALVSWIIPNAIISIIVYLLIRKFSK